VGIASSLTTPVRPAPGSMPMILPSNMSALPLRSAIDSIFVYFGTAMVSTALP
jgi:hypothetical protein